MKKSEIFRRLRNRIPLFDTFPEVPESHKRIIGTESEYGVANTEGGDPLIDSHRLPIVLTNGGEVYEDNGHVEYASPETADPVSAVLFYEAGKRLCWNEKFSRALFCNNSDSLGNTFGSHENYFTCAPRNTWHNLVPFLIARTALCGSGWIKNDSQFEISQRARFIHFAFSNCTTTQRAIINIRPEPLSDVPGFCRLHIICGDAGMSEVATLLRLGTMSCVLRLLEGGELPEVSYDSNYVDQDILNISRLGWNLAGIRKGPKHAIDLLALYLSSAKKFLSGTDDVTDIVLAIWEDTLRKLRREDFEETLWRRLDWVAKRLLLRTFAENTREPDLHWMLQAQDMAYHDLNPDVGLYYHLVQQGEMERVVSDDLIARALYAPPPNTRASARGKIACVLDKNQKYAIASNSWSKIVILDSTARKSARIVHCPPPKEHYVVPMPDPRKTYTDEVGLLGTKLLLNSI